MKITEAEYQTLCPSLIALCRQYGHPLKIPPMAFMPLLAEAGIQAEPGEMVLDFYAVFIHGNLPQDGASALQRVLERLEQEVYETTGRYPVRPTISN